MGPDQPTLWHDFGILIQIATRREGTIGLQNAIQYVGSIGFDSHIKSAIGTGARSEPNTLLNQPIDAGYGAGGRRMRSVDFQGDSDQVDPS